MLALQIAIREIHPQLVLPSNTSRYACDILIFEPKSGPYYSQVFLTDSPLEGRLEALKATWGVYIGNGSIYVFFPNARRIDIDSAKGSAINIDDAQAQAPADSKKSIDENGNFEVGPSWSTASLYNPPLDFFIPAGSAAFTGQPKILTIKREDHKWFVTWRREWDMELVLSDKFSLLSYRRLN